MRVDLVRYHALRTHARGSDCAANANRDRHRSGEGRGIDRVGRTGLDRHVSRRSHHGTLDGSEHLVGEAGGIVRGFVANKIP